MINDISYEYTYNECILPPEDEGLRIRGRRLLLSDILGKSLQWKSFNGTWINGEYSFHPTNKELKSLILIIDVELVFRDISGGLSILNLDNYTIRILMTNSTFVSFDINSRISRVFEYT